jgi:TPP-dependent indolepyruvate ferredoxin oxidoreductase alpha subunit
MMTKLWRFVDYVYIIGCPNNTIFKENKDPLLTLEDCPFYSAADMGCAMAVTNADHLGYFSTLL